jgi:ribosomal protein S18 acetylase RimI-like enzyme
MPDPTIRRYRAADAEQVRKLHVAAMREYDAFDQSAALNEDLEDVDGHYLDAGGEFLVATNDGSIVAMGAFRPTDGYLREFVPEVSEDAAAVKRMRVAPAHQRQGHGQAIYDELESRARDAGFSEFVLDTTPEQTAARRFYETNGFEEAARQEVKPGDTAFELLCYRKRLD